MTGATTAPRVRRIAHPGRLVVVGVLILALVLGFGLWWALARTGADHEAGDAEASETAAASADPSHPSAQASASPQPSAPATAIADPEAPKDSFTDAPAPKDAEPQALDAALADLGAGVTVEFKLDGARIQVHRDGDDVRVWTRTLREITDGVPELVARLLAATDDDDAKPVPLRCSRSHADA